MLDLVEYHRRRVGVDLDLHVTLDRQGNLLVLRVVGVNGDHALRWTLVGAGIERRGKVRGLAWSHLTLARLRDCTSAGGLNGADRQHSRTAVLQSESMLNRSALKN